MTSSHGTAALAVYYILFFIALFLVLIRIYVRVRVTQGRFENWGWDETTIVIAQVMLFLGLIIVQIQVNHGLGKHITEIRNPKDIQQILRLSQVYEMAQVVCTLFTKISISFYILRFKDSRTLRWLMTVFMTLISFATIAVIVVLSMALHSLMKEPDKPFSFPEMFIVAYVQSGLTIVIDLGMTSLPIIMLWSIRIKPSQKTFIGVLMSLGLIATLSNALRNLFLKTLPNQDFTHDTLVCLVAVIESCSGIIAACIPACIPIFKLRKYAEERRKSKGYVFRSDHRPNDQRSIKISKSYAVEMKPKTASFTENESVNALVQHI